MSFSNGRAECDGNCDQCCLIERFSNRAMFDRLTVGSVDGMNLHKMAFLFSFSAPCVLLELDELANTNIFFHFHHFHCFGSVFSSSSSFLRDGSPFQVLACVVSHQTETKWTAFFGSFVCFGLRVQSGRGRNEDKR